LKSAKRYIPFWEMTNQLVRTNDLLPVASISMPIE
jgi:hypothetical protein